MDTRLSKNESPKWIDDAVVLKADLMLRDIGINMTEPSTYVHRWQYILLPAVVVPSLKLLNQNDSSSSNLPCSMEMKYDDKILCSCHPSGIIHQTRSRFESGSSQSVVGDQMGTTGWTVGSIPDDPGFWVSIFDFLLGFQISKGGGNSLRSEVRVTATVADKRWKQSKAKQRWERASHPSSAVRSSIMLTMHISNGLIQYQPYFSTELSNRSLYMRDLQLPPFQVSYTEVLDACSDADGSLIQQYDTAVSVLPALHWVSMFTSVLSYISYTCMYWKRSALSHAIRQLMGLKETHTQ